MTFKRIIEIPDNRRITLEVPPELPVGKARVEFIVTPEIVPNEKTVKPLASFAGIDKERDTMDAYFARKRADKEKEDAQFERMRCP